MAMNFHFFPCPICHMELFWELREITVCVCMYVCVCVCVCVCIYVYMVCCCSVSQSCPTLCDSMYYKTARISCPSLSARICSHSCALSWWCHPTILSSVAAFSSCPQSFPTSGYFPMSWLFTSGGQTVDGIQSQNNRMIWFIFKASHSTSQ